MKEHFIVKSSTRKKQFYYEKKISLGKKKLLFEKGISWKESNIRKRELYY